MMPNKDHFSKWIPPRFDNDDRRRDLKLNQPVIAVDPAQPGSDKTAVDVRKGMENIATFSPTEPIVDMCLHDNRIFVATTHHVYRMNDDGVFEQMMFRHVTEEEMEAACAAYRKAGK